MTKRSVFAIDAGVLIALGGCLKPRAEAEVNLAAVLDRGELGMAMGRRLLRHLDPQGERHVLIAHDQKHHIKRHVASDAHSGRARERRPVTGLSAQAPGCSSDPFVRGAQA